MSLLADPNDLAEPFLNATNRKLSIEQVSNVEVDAVLRIIIIPSYEDSHELESGCTCANFWVI